MLDERGLGRVVQERCERALAVVVVLAVEVRDGLPFHVRLAGEDEHLDRLRRAIGPNLGTGAENQRREQDECAVYDHGHILGIRKRGASCGH